MANNLKKNVFSVFNRLNEYRKEGKFCDVKLIVEGTAYPCHRNILAASCKYFEIMFNSSFQEGLGLSNEISIGDIDNETFEVILEFIYTHRAKITKNNAYSLLKKSNFFDLVDLERRCINYILETPTVNHLLEICEFANATKKDSFLEKLVPIVASNFKWYSTNENFLNLSYDVLKPILQSLKNTDDLEANGEDDQNASEKLALVIEWVKRDVSGRTKYLEELLSLITLPSQFHGVLTSAFFDYVTNVVRTDSETLSIYCVTSTNKENTFADVSLLNFKNVSWTWKKNVIKEPICFRVINAEKENYYLTYTKQDTNVTNQFFNDKSEDMQIPPVCVSSYAMTSFSSTIFLYNYSGNFLPLEKVRSWTTLESEDAKREHMFVYNILQNKWFSTPPIPEYLYNSYMVSVNHLIYLIGGTDQFDKLKGRPKNIIQVYDTRSSRWTQTSTNIKFVLNGAACVLLNKIYILEKSLSDERMEGNANRLYVFDTLTNTWETFDNEYKVPLPYLMIPFKSKLWVFSYNADVKGAVYDTQTNTWSEMPRLPEKLLTSGGSASVLRVVGGVVV